MSNQEPTRFEETGTSKVEDGVDQVKKLSDSQKETIVNFIEYLIDVLSFRRVFLIALLGFMLLGLFSVYEHRGSIMNHILSTPLIVDKRSDPDSKSWELSDTSKQSLIALTKTLPIKFVDVTEVDLKRNSRMVRFAHITDPIPHGVVVEKFMSELYQPHSVFDYDTKNTSQMVAVLANEFQCSNYIDTMYYKIAPEAAASVATICHMAIPPFVGQFAGYLTIGLERKMTKTELDTIRLELSRIAVEIYLGDVTKQPRDIAKGE